MQTVPFIVLQMVYLVN